MGVQRLLSLLGHFLSVVLFYGAQFALNVSASDVSASAPFAGVSKHAIDPQFAKTTLTSQVVFFGVDGSVLVHNCLRRCMTDVVVNRDFTSFKSEMRNILVRLQLQTKKYGALGLGCS